MQQQALRDYGHAMSNFYAGAHGRPTFRKAGRHEGFRIVGSMAGRVERVSKRLGRVRVPKVGWITFRWSRQVPEAKSYRVTRDRAGRWHLAFAAAPDAIPAPGNGASIGVDRGVAVSAALSNGDMERAPGLRPMEAERLRRLNRRLSRGKPGSKRRGRVKAQIARIEARAADRRKDWAEKLSTRLARDYDLIALEQLNVRAMTACGKGTVERPGRNVRQKAGLNKRILASGWGLLERRLNDKAPGRVVKVNAAYTSLRCNACWSVNVKNRESQAFFSCVTCGHTANADFNAACNIRDVAKGRTGPEATAARHAVAARGGNSSESPMNREPLDRARRLTAAREHSQEPRRHRVEGMSP